MSARPLPLVRRNRWAISFADLLLLLLAFFVLLQASGSRRGAMRCWRRSAGNLAAGRWPMAWRSAPLTCSCRAKRC
ncbi:hypothetical protein LL253_09065 [Sphingobium soli]|uniref:Motility protein B-like N-terminal domain-containing protein n=1 Tax=Sphingobium soli TaxID=1591116 RepID=A0ABS8H2U9_9SPHN|nr:hypothetical protein [Sphingobium soli]